MADIKLYALTTCDYCQALKKMFTDLNVNFDCIEADTLFGDERKVVLAELRKYNSNASFPTVVINDTVIVGYKVQEIKETLGIRTEVDALYEQLKKINEKKGYFFSHNKERTFELIRGLLTNKERYGYMACPCRLAEGDKSVDQDIICPCDYREPDVAEYGSCYCGLYVSTAWNNKEIEHQYVPERRQN